jgi:mRNA-degrading endonuclease toxin of MazEF toxin-antitoxin module
MTATKLSQVKIRPAIIVSKDSNNARLDDVIIVPCSSNVDHSHEPTQHLLVGKDLTESGMRVPSVIRCEAVMVIHKSMILKKTGKLSTPTMQKVDNGLKEALGLKSASETKTMK